MGNVAGTLANGAAASSARRSRQRGQHPRLRMAEHRFAPVVGPSADDRRVEIEHADSDSLPSSGANLKNDDCSSHSLDLQLGRASSAFAFAAARQLPTASILWSPQRSCAPACPWSCPTDGLEAVLEEVQMVTASSSSCVFASPAKRAALEWTLLATVTVARTPPRPSKPIALIWTSGCRIDCSSRQIEGLEAIDAPAARSVSAGAFARERPIDGAGHDFEIPSSSAPRAKSSQCCSTARRGVEARRRWRSVLELSQVDPRRHVLMANDLLRVEPSVIADSNTVPEIFTTISDFVLDGLQRATRVESAGVPKSRACALQLASCFAFARRRSREVIPSSFVRRWGLSVSPRSAC